MRVILVGPDARRLQLRAQLPDGIDVVAEQDTLGAAPIGDADAFLLAANRADQGASLMEPLTRREMQVLELLADGMSNKGIAARLGISDETVKFHLVAIFGKLGASNRTDAVRLALRRGLVPL